jgi:hypothetical protein
MEDSGVRKAIVLELFAATGESIPEDDPIVTGAILFSHMLNEVARLSAEDMRLAGQLAADAVNEAAGNASKVLVDASVRCASESAAASGKAAEVARMAELQIERLTAERAQLLKLVEAHVLKGVKVALKQQADPLPLGHMPTWWALAGAVIGAVVFSTGWTIAAAHGSVQAEEAAVGRAFNRVAPTLDPKIKAQLYERLRNPG